MNEKYGFYNATITKQAFFKQRQWLDPQIFMDIIHTSLTNLYSDCYEYLKNFIGWDIKG
jgi:hypothetical protein